MGFCLVAGSAAADTLPSKPPQYRFDVFGTEAGLPQTNVTAAVQTRDGYLWVGTEAGLGRFDGVRFVSWRKSNTAALLSHSIRCLFEDREGALWIGTEKGLVHYRDGRFEHAGFADAVVTAIAQARDGHLWVGTAESGLHRLADRRADAATQRTDLGGGIQCLFFDSSDRLWVGVRDRPGVLYRNDGEWIHFDGNGRIGGHTNAICETPGGTIWLGNAFGVYRIRKNGAVTHFGKAAGLLYVQIRDIRPAKDGGLWIASSVLHHVSNLETFDCLPIANPGVRSINRLCEDAEGNVWLCAMAEALVRVRRAHFRTFPAIDEIPGPVIKAVAEDPHGDIWIAVQRTGVARLKPDGRLEPLPIESGLPSADPRSILAARDGAVWIAYSNGLSVWRDGTLQTYSAQRFVHAMYEDASGRIWFGGERVFATYEQGRGLQPFPTDSIGTLSPYAFAADNTGAIYVGLPTGVRKYRDGVAEKIAGLDELPTGPVRALFVDSEGRLWVGMKGRGLGVLADEAWLNPDTLAEAVADHVSAITEDAEGRLWLGTPTGVVWAAKDDLMAVARGDRAVPRLRNAGVGDGFRIMPVISGTQPAVWKSRDQQLLFATRRGLLGIDPRDVPANAVAPRVQIEEAMVDGQTIPRPDRLEIAPGRQAVAIGYTAPSFVQPGRVMFQYKLDGYEKDWVHAGTRRTAFYTNLPPGNYVFRVKACNSDGVWDERGASLDVVQLPRFYQTWWFYAAGGLGLVGLGFGVNRWSHRRLAMQLALLEEKQAAEKERRRIAKDLHDDIGASLTEISLFAEKVKRRATSPDLATTMTFLSLRVHRMVAALDAVVWTVNPANDSLDRLVSFIAEMFQEFLQLTSIRCRLEISGDFPSIPLTPEQRSNVFLTAKEAINNVVRHSEATEARLCMTMEGNAFVLVLEDNGRGFDSDVARVSGNGLANMRSRIAELHGEIVFDSAQGRGSRISIRVPFNGRDVN